MFLALSTISVEVKLADEVFGGLLLYLVNARPNLALVNLFAFGRVRMCCLNLRSFLVTEDELIMRGIKLRDFLNENILNIPNSHIGFGAHFKRWHV